MLSSVFLSGRLGDVFAPKMRYVEIERVVTSPAGTGTYAISKVPVRAQCLETNRFLKEPNGTYICLKGRLEADEEYGLIIVSELDEMFDASSKKTRAKRKAN